MATELQSALNKKPVPLMPTVVGNKCPICGQRSYSLHGIHPQCAVQQADAPRQALLQGEKRERARLDAEQRQIGASN